MDPVIIMVGHNEEGVQDIEVMPDIPAEELADAIADAFGWNGTYDIQINGKLLGRRQTLAEVNAWDGSELILVVSNRPVRVKKPPKAASNYRLLQVSSQIQNEVTQEQPENSEKTFSKTKNSQEHQSFHPAQGETQHPGFNWDPVVPESPKITLLSSPVTNNTKILNSSETSEESDPKS